MTLSGHGFRKPRAKLDFDTEHSNRANSVISTHVEEVRRNPAFGQYTIWSLRRTSRHMIDEPTSASAFVMRVHMWRKCWQVA